MTETNASFDDVKAVVVHVLGLEDRANDLQPSTPLLGSLPELDSMAVVELVTALEERFGLEFDEADITGEVFESMGSLVTFVNSQLG